MAGASAFNSKLVKGSKKFQKWFWDGTNGNELIKELNKYAETKNIDDRIRREKERPAVYAVVVNNFLEKELRLVKVGFTHKSIKKTKDDPKKTEKVSKNRMEQLVEQIDIVVTKSNPKAKASTLFALPIGCIDTTSFSRTEERIRKKVGIPVKKEKARKESLPVPTEWVLTTQQRIKEIKDKIKSVCQESQEDAKDVIDVFKDFNKASQNVEIPDNYKDWLEEDES